MTNTTCPGCTRKYGAREPHCLACRPCAGCGFESCEGTCPSVADPMTEILVGLRAEHRERLRAKPGVPSLSHRRARQRALDALPRLPWTDRTRLKRELHQLELTEGGDIGR